MNLHRVDLVSLSLFSLVARTGSISKGAELASLAVGAVSRRLSDLERALSTPLLERHSRGVTLTQAGLALQRHARRILSDVDEMAADLSDYASGMTGVVRMWATTSAVTQFLPYQLSTFGRVLKNRVQVRSFDAICQMVAAGMGVALLPDAAVEPLLRDLKLRRIALDEPWATRSLLIGVRDLDGLQRHARRFLDHLVRGDRASPGSGLPSSAATE